jgi:predicted permease
VPALQSTKPDVAHTLKDEGGSVTGGRKRLTVRNGLLVTQVAISMVLLLGAGLFLRSLMSAQDMDLGFSARDGGIAWTMMGLSDIERADQEQLVRAIEERTLALPGVDRVATADMLPLGVVLQTTTWDIPGVEPPAGQDHLSFRYNVVSASYFDVMGIPIVSGRPFTEEDRADSESVAIISQVTADRYWPDGDALGGTIQRTWTEESYRIVGIAQDTKVWWLGEEIQPYVYLSRPQSNSISAFFLARGSIPDAQITSQLRRVIREVDPRVVIMESKTMSGHLSVQLYPARAAAGLLGAFGLLALVLASTGLYGAVAFAVSRRTREMGIRISLGASTKEVIGMVLKGAMGLVALGGTVGLALGVGLARVVSGFLYGIDGLDLVTFIGIPAVLFGAAALAAFLPARRASRVNPVQALRSE